MLIGNEYLEDLHPLSNGVEITQHYTENTDRQMGVSPKASFPKKNGSHAREMAATGLRSARREPGQQARSSLCFFQGGTTPMQSRYKLILLFCLRKILNCIKSPQTVTQQQQH